METLAYSVVRLYWVLGIRAGVFLDARAQIIPNRPTVAMLFALATTVMNTNFLIAIIAFVVLGLLGHVRIPFIYIDLDTAMPNSIVTVYLPCPLGR